MSERRIDTFRLIWLEAFLAVAETESFTEAGKVMGCNQSSVTRYVRRLERWFGFTAFVRRYPAKLSEEGEAFVETARNIRDSIRDSRTPQAIDTIPRPK